MYEPAGEVNEVGGDFYEVFPVEGGWAVVLGDVSGKGAAAAALTAEARHTIRTAGRWRRTRSPAFTCSTRTCADATTSPCARSRWSCSPTPTGAELRGPRLSRRASAPMLVRDGARAGGRPRAAARGGRGARWEPVAVAIEPGDQLVLYTDGVIEARGDGGERFGSERLRAGLAGCATPDLAVERVRDALSAVRRPRPGRRRGPGRDSPHRPARRVRSPSRRVAPAASPGAAT